MTRLVPSNVALRRGFKGTFPHWQPSYSPNGPGHIQTDLIRIRTKVIHIENQLRKGLRTGWNGREQGDIWVGQWFIYSMFSARHCRTFTISPTVHPCRTTACRRSSHQRITRSSISSSDMFRIVVTMRVTSYIQHGIMPRTGWASLSVMTSTRTLMILFRKVAADPEW